MAENIPSGVDIHQSASQQMIASIIPCMVLAALAVAGRLASRAIKRVPLLLSDYLSIASLAGAWVVSLIIIEEANLGLGKHIEVVPLANVREILLTIYIAEIFYSITFMLIKASLLLLLRAVFPGRGIEWATLIISIFVAMWGIAAVLVSVFSCTPVQGFWDPTIPSTCVNTRWFFVGNAIPNIMADLAILILPVHRVWNLQMSIRSKMAVSFVFLLGGFVIVASALRIVFMLNMNFDDLTWSYQGIGTWTAVEIDVAVICSCLPTIRPALAWLVPSSMSTRFSSANNTAHSGQWSNKRLYIDKSTTIVTSSHAKDNGEPGEFYRMPDYPMRKSDSSGREQSLV